MGSLSPDEISIYVVVFLTAAFAGFLVSVMLENW